MNTSSDSADPYPVYVGAWTNWSRGRVLGATLTLSRRDADLLIAFTAFFVAFVATRVWRILCFAIHRFCSKKTPQNAIYHQHQAILRNSSTPEDGIRLLAYLLWAGRKSKGCLRPLSTAAVAAVCLLSFTIAGGFSSYISTAIGDEVLIKSSNCGRMDAGPGIFETPSVVNSYISERLSNAANYAQQCYSTSSGGSLLNCGRFITKQIVSSIDRNAPCPFHDELCLDASSNLRIDSGYLSSHDHFGLNAPPDQRVLWRNVYHCAPLVTAGYTSLKNTSFGEATLYHYGNITTSEVFDYVYAARSLDDQYSFPISNSSAVSYSNFDLQSSSVVVKNRAVKMDGSDFLPIDSIYRNDADLSLHFLSGNGVLFLEPSDDAWYRVASRNFTIGIVGSNDTISRYISSEPASPLGCIDQYQFCSSSGSGWRGQCGPLASPRDAAAGAAALFDTNYVDLFGSNATSRAAALFTYIAGAIADSTVANVVGHLGPASLLSQRYLLYGDQYFLNARQWQLDVKHWWDIVMASRQAYFLGLAYGPVDPVLLANRINYTTPEFKGWCDSQIIRTTAYGSFSLFGLIFIFSFGGSLILSSYLLEPVTALLYRKRGYRKYQHLEWISNATLHLQRLAQEAAGFGTWHGSTNTVPSTETDELLGSLDLTDPDHPVLRLSSLEKGLTGNDSRGSTEIPSAVQMEDVSSPTVASNRPSLQNVPSITHSTIPSTTPREASVELPQLHDLEPDSETAQVTVESQGNKPSYYGTDVALDGERDPD